MTIVLSSHRMDLQNNQFKLFKLATKMVQNQKKSLNSETELRTEGVILISLSRGCWQPS